MSNFAFKRDLFEKIDGLTKDMKILGAFTIKKTDAIMTQLDNHLKHHEYIEKKKSDRVFKIGMIIFQVLLTYLVIHGWK